MEHVLPFAYSSTKWIGDVQGTAAPVTITELTGTDADGVLSGGDGGR